jgi:hypothetical protein
MLYSLSLGLAFAAENALLNKLRWEDKIEMNLKERECENER